MTAYEQAIKVDERYSLSENDRQLRMLSRTSTLPGRTGEHARHLYVQRVEQYATALKENPFLPPPASISEGTYTLGTAGKHHFRLADNETLRHIGVPGPSGSGKTTLFQILALQARARGTHVIAPDFKGDLQWLAATDDDFLIFHPDIPFNILDHDHRVDREHHKDLVTRLLALSFYAGEHLKQVGHETLTLAYEQHDPPSVNDWLAITNNLVSPKDTYQRRDALGGLTNRLRRFQSLFPGMTRTRDGIPHHVIAERSVYLGAPHHNETYDFLAALLVHVCHEQAHARQQRDTLLRWLLLDEGLLLFGQANRIDGPVLLPLIPLLREYGTALAISTAHFGGIHETLRANTYTTIVLPLANATDAPLAARTLGLNPAQADYLLRLHLGQAVVKTGKWELPFLMTFTPPNINKTVNHDDWQRAIQRTNNLAPNETPIIRPAPKPTPQTAPTMPVPKTPDPIIPPVTLTDPQSALLNSVADLVIPTSTEAYRRAKLTLAVGDASAKQNEVLGYLNRNPITSRPGRGGSAISLELTTLGYERLNKKPPHQTRGGDSAQHRYLVHQLAKHITSSKIEATVGVGGRGGKSVDILVRITEDHERLRQAIALNTRLLSPTPHELAVGDLVAIEVEVSDPSKTAPANAVANTKHGITTTIIAVMPKTLDTTRKHLLKNLPAEVLHRVVLVDALQLLEGLR